MRGVQDTEARDRFLAQLSSGLGVTQAANAAGISRRQAYRWRDRCEKVAAAWPKRGVSARTQRRKAKAEREETAESLAADSGDCELAELLRVRKLAMSVLEYVATSGGKDHSPRVSAARELLRATEAAYKAAKARAEDPVSVEPQAQAGPPATPDLEAVRLRLLG